MTVMDKIYSAFEEHIQGGVAEYPMTEEWLVEEAQVCTSGFFLENEMKICLLFDEHFFQCTECGWTMPIEDLAEDYEWTCGDCTY